MSYHHHHHSHSHHTIILFDKSKLGMFQIKGVPRKRRKTGQSLILRKSRDNKLSSFFNLVNEEPSPHLNHTIPV